jgi:hypothetical protein
MTPSILLIGFLLVAGAALTVPMARADVLRWTDGAEPTSFGLVLRYDNKGALLGPAGSDSFDASHLLHGQSDLETGDIAAHALGPTARRAAVLPFLRLTTTRYAEHPALEIVGLGPVDWALLFEALIETESGFNTQASSPAGARGLAQLMPDTAQNLGANIDNPAENLDGGARYLLTQIETFGAVDLALAAYNAGPAAVRRYRGIPPYAETQDYVARVMAKFARLQRAHANGDPL